MGVCDNEQYKYEVYISVKGLEYYKYRIMFLEHGTIAYPVKIVLSEELAYEYSQKKIYTFNIDTMKALEDMMDKIINSQTMVKLLQSLINEAIRQENEIS